MRDFTFKYYFQTLTILIREPKKFFMGLQGEAGLKKPLGFLIVSSILFALAGILGNIYTNPFVMGSIFLVNALGMVFIAAGLGYIVMTLTIGKKVGFNTFFSIYAFSSGVTLLASWVPFFFWLTEPWKWWLIGTGMVKCCGFKTIQAVSVIGLSVGIIILFFWLWLL